MDKVVVYRCEYCGKEFDTYDECLKHEESHEICFADATNKQLISALRELAQAANAYRIGKRVMGMPIHSFTSLMCEAADRLISGNRQKGDQL